MTLETSLPNLHARVLVVDDHPNTATTLARTISQLGPDIEVISATSSKAAIELIKDTAVDLVITDMMMPDMNGLELIESIRTGPAGPPNYTILITAYDVPGLRESARRLKVNEVIIKPVRPERIYQIVGDALKSIRYSSSDGPTLNARTKFKILIADDLPDNVSLLSRYMASAGYVFTTAADGVEALAKIRAEMPDLILLDVNMPEKDGFAVLQEVRADPAIEHIPVIILTAARIGPADMQSGFNLGADDYMTKPFDRRELLARIRTKLRVKETEDLIRRRNRELGMLPEIGRELSARLDIDELADVVLRRTVGTLGAALGHLIIFDASGASHKKYSIASQLPEAELPSMDAFLPEIRETRQGLIIDDAQMDARWRRVAGDQTRAVIIVPMFGRLTLLGLLILTHEEAKYFTLEHQLLLQAIASQAAIAVENAQLYASKAQEERRLSAVLQGAADAILMFDANDRLVLINPAGETLFTDIDVKTGKPLSPGQGYDAFISLLTETRLSGAQQTDEIVWPDKRVFSAVVTSIGEAGCVALLHDVSHFKALERAKDEFISAASHDLKSPITVITGFSQLLTTAGSLNDKQMEFVDHIHAAAKNMEELVQALLDLAKFDMNTEPKRENVELGGLIADIGDELRTQFEAKEQEFTFETPARRLDVLGDPAQLKQAIRNLVGNAVKYTPEGGSIEISVKTGDNDVKVLVKDTGYGIPADALPFIFDRFYRVNNDEIQQIEGNGLGLAIVKAITERHGGKISVESEPGQGSCFTFALPLVQPETPVVQRPKN